jgi:putative Mn2+ efflux pump MntP
MLEVLVFGVLAGVDNLQVCSTIGLLPVRPARMHKLAAAFACSEIGGAVAGLFLGRALLALLGPWGTRVAPLAMLGCGAAVVLLALRSKDVDDAVNSDTVLVGLPLSLSVDNVIAGAGLSLSSRPLVTSAVVIGCVSGAMSAFGLYFGGWFRRFLPKRSEWAVGAFLCALAVRMMLTDAD